ncbi:hypothetical protein BDV95DRAFT_309539 [Massariosphaeria phaeospora]|uniref:Uncharacterized protein n=1 Tax=Massariosphaeria phaeospora TaxID=100035 RepID=A0A7C8MGY8_9PLEO|nr:hypothetical protein BDV95DRAFT_309539 [Massariosphaeria phaeospora]
MLHIDTSIDPNAYLRGDFSNIPSDTQAFARLLSNHHGSISSLPAAQRFFTYPPESEPLAAKRFVSRSLNAEPTAFKWLFARPANAKPTSTQRFLAQPCKRRLPTTHWLLPPPNGLHTTKRTSSVRHHPQLQVEGQPRGQPKFGDATLMYRP